MKPWAMEQLDLLHRGPAKRETADPPEDAPAPPPALPSSALAELLPPALGGAISATFACMAVAEQEIEAARSRWPDRAQDIDRAFRFLTPTEVLSRTSPELYRHHAHELLERVATGKELGPGTDAEVLAALVEITLAAPPSRELTLLYMKLFSGLFPTEAREFFEGITPDLYEEERMAELEGELRRKLGAERDCHKR